jgi:phage/plasmid-associated DNA primase
LDWGHFLRQHVDVKLSRHDLITKTLPAMYGSSVLMFGILDQPGCKTLRVRFLPDAIPFKTADLNLNTGLINCDVNLSLNLIASIEDCSDYILAEILIKHRFNLRLGFYEGDYYRLVEENGAWDRIEKDQAQSVIREELNVLFTRTLHLVDFQRVVGLNSESATAMRKMMRKYCGTHQGVGDVLKAVLPKLRFEPPKELPHLACFKNGLVDLRTKTLLGPANPSDYVTKSIPHIYDPNADQTTVKKFMGSLFPKNVYEDSADILEFHQIHSGSLLTLANVMPAVLFLVGEGSNGKSKYCELARKSMGKSYHATIAAEALQKDPGENNDNLYRARSARCATIVEIEKGKQLSAKMIKGLTGGDLTEMSAKFKNGLEVETVFTMHVFSNDVPEFTVKPSDDFALARRFAVLPMRVQFLDDNDATQRAKLKCAGHEHWACSKDEGLVKSLIDDSIPGFLAYMVDGAAKLFANDCKLLLPPTIKNATNQEKGDDEDELIQDFIGTQLTRALDSRERTFISTEEMMNVYTRLHCKESCLLKSATFFTKLKVGIVDVFVKHQIEGRDAMVVWGKKKGVPSPMGPKELRGYFNLIWKTSSDGAVEAEKLRNTYPAST